MCRLATGTPGRCLPSATRNLLVLILVVAQHVDGQPVCGGNFLVLARGLDD